MVYTTMKEEFGPEYPLVIRHSSGELLKLIRESRFSRQYKSDQADIGLIVSRFRDKSASISYRKLVFLWNFLSKQTRKDLCQGSSWLKDQTDFSKILEFIMKHGNEDNWNDVADTIATHLSQEEAFRLLRSAADKCTHPAPMIFKAILKTKHPEVRKQLISRMDKIRSHPQLWDDSEFMNEHAVASVGSIQNLIDFGEDPASFTDLVHVKLSQHICEQNRNYCSYHLRKYYNWLPSSVTDS